MRYKIEVWDDDQQRWGDDALGSESGCYATREEAEAGLKHLQGCANDPGDSWFGAKIRLVEVTDE